MFYVIQILRIVTRLMNRLKDEDPYFDYRLHYDQHQQVDAVAWQTGPMRAALRSMDRQLALIPVTLII